MQQIIKQDLEFFSNHDFLRPQRPRHNLPRYDNHTSFAQLSNWTNSDHLHPTSLPRINTRVETLKQKTKLTQNNSICSNSISNNCCPIKQMDLSLQPLKNDEESFYCKYLKNKNKLPLKQIEFITSTERSKRNRSPKMESVSTGKLKEIIKRKKDSQFNVNIDQYLRTTQIAKRNSPAKLEKIHIS